MKYAIASYLGMPVSSDECRSYTAYKDDGLLCPFCSQPVFLRQGTEYWRGDNLVVTPSAFCHFPGVDADSCELRSKRKEGKAYVSKLKAKARGQRLEIYNDHLWNMFAEDRQFKTKDILGLKDFAGKKATKMINGCRRACKARLRSLDHFRDSEELFTELFSTSYKELKEEKLTAEQLASISKTTEQRIAYFQGINKILHKQICREIFEFLCTAQAGKAFTLFTFATYGVMAKQRPEAMLGKADDDEIARSLFCLLIATKWTDKIKQHSSEKEHAAVSH